MPDVSISTEKAKSSLLQTVLLKRHRKHQELKLNSHWNGRQIMRKTTKTSLDDIIKEQMNDPKFAEAWAETELEDQIKRILIQARIDAGLNQKELAEKSGIRQSNISRIENGSAIPTLQTLNAIAKGVGKKLKISFE